MAKFIVYLAPSEAEKEIFKSLRNIFDVVGIKYTDFQERGEMDLYGRKENVTVLGYRSAVAYVHHHRPEAIFGLNGPNAFDYFDRSWLLNDDMQIVRVKDIDWGGGELFVKSHTPYRLDQRGKIFKAGKYSEIMPPATGDDGERLVEVSSLKAIVNEYRAFVIDGEVIGSCWYATDGNMTIIPSIPQDVVDFFAACARKCPHTYVIDVARTDNNELKIIEMNTFNSSGLMGIDLYGFAVALKKHFDSLDPRKFELTVEIPHAKTREAGLISLHTCRSYTLGQALSHMVNNTNIPLEVVTRDGNGTYFVWGNIVHPDRETAREKSMYYLQ